MSCMVSSSDALCIQFAWISSLQNSDCNQTCDNQDCFSVPLVTGIEQMIHVTLIGKCGKFNWHNYYKEINTKIEMKCSLRTSLTVTLKCLVHGVSGTVCEQELFSCTWKWRHHQDLNNTRDTFYNPRVANRQLQTNKYKLMTTTITKNRL